MFVTYADSPETVAAVARTPPGHDDQSLSFIVVCGRMKPSGSRPSIIPEHQTTADCLVTGASTSTTPHVGLHHLRSPTQNPNICTGSLTTCRRFLPPIPSGRQSIDAAASVANCAREACISSRFTHGFVLNLVRTLLELPRLCFFVKAKAKAQVLGIAPLN